MKTLTILALLVGQLSAQKITPRSPFAGAGRPRTTATQAILSYTAPNAEACTVEVSESPTYSPLVHDVDGSLFPGDNLDSRADSYSTGWNRVLVIGKRRAEKGVDGHWYSRALQTATPHYYRITCGGTVIVKDSFTTANIVLGNTYNEPYPGDPKAAARPYYSTVGSYAWPEFLKWDRTDPAARQESVIDPHTGMLLKRLALPQDQPINYLPGYGDHAFTGMRSVDGAWTIAGTAATFTGSASNFLHLRDASLVIGGINGASLYEPTLPMEYITLSLKGSCSGACAGEDAKVQACITLNGINCWPTNAAAKYQEAALPTAAASAFITLGSAVPILDAWTPAGFLPLNRADLVARFGTANVDAAGVMNWVSGTYFSPNWIAGSRVYVQTTQCTLAAPAGVKQMRIDPASCDTPLPLPLTATGFSGSNFGFLIRKKTASADRIAIQDAKYLTGSSLYMDWTASGSAKLCSETLTKNTVTGGLGFHCLMISNLPMLYWIDHQTGDANYLGLFGAPTGGGSGADGFTGASCTIATLTGTTPTAPEHVYCTATDNETPSKAVIVSCDVTSNNQAGYGISCNNITPGSRGKDLNSLVVAFTAGQTPSFDPALFGCGVASNQGTKIVLGCGRFGGVQDTAAWFGVFDPLKVGTAPGCVGGGAPGCIVGMANTWSSPGARWCSLHTLFNAGNSDTLWIAGKYFVPESPAKPLDGPYTSDIVSGLMTAAPAIAAGTGACPGGSKGCSQVTADGEPCDPSPAAGEAAASPCPKNPASVFLQNAAVGDTFLIEGEITRLVAKAGNVWTLQRGYGYTVPVDHTSPTLNASCNAHDFDHGSSEWSWTWDSAADPHGLNASGTTVLTAYPYDHPLITPEATIGGMPYYETGCKGQPCYAVRFNSSPLGDPPNHFATLSPPFARAIGTAFFVERAQDHPSRFVDAAPASEKGWFIDGRPLVPQPDIADVATPISGSLYEFNSTPTDPDNLRFIGGPGAPFGGLNRKLQPTWAYCGTQPMIDASSAATGDVLSDTAVDGYKYCIARKAGECRAASQVGKIYMNCPNASKRQDGTYGCAPSYEGPDTPVDMCISNSSQYLNGISQIGFAHDDFSGSLGRMLTKGLGHYRYQDGYWHGKTLSDASWILFRSYWTNGAWISVLLGKMPPYPVEDGIDRSTFQAIPVTVTPPPGVDNVVVRFGYAENGPSGSFFCTSRKEACLATATEVPVVPFQFPSDNPAGLPCANRCTVAVPALSQHMLYYQVAFRDAQNQVVSTAQVEVVAVP